MAQKRNLQIKKGKQREENDKETKIKKMLKCRPLGDPQPIHLT